jgi:hypothetical protein
MQVVNSYREIYSRCNCDEEECGYGQKPVCDDTVNQHCLFGEMRGKEKWGTARVLYEG